MKEMATSSKIQENKVELRLTASDTLPLVQPAKTSKEQMPNHEAINQVLQNMFILSANLVTTQDPSVR